MNNQTSYFSNIRNRLKIFLLKIVHHVYFKHLVIALGISAILLLLIFAFLRIYTYHNQAFPVPNIKGINLEEAKKIINENDLRYEVTDSIFKQDAKKGSVIDQNPAPGFNVKKNRRIFLIINANQPEKVKMPDLEQQTLRQAKSILDARGLSIGEINYVPDMDNRIKKQFHDGKEITPLTMINKGSHIDLVVGNTNSNKRVKPPELTGMTPEKARNILTDQYLNLGAIIHDNSFKNYQDSLSAVIYKQKPESDVGRISLGSSVDVWVTADSTKLE
ncbi:MAG: PASTA domain-containing protein [Bacteroidota bacterium]